MKKCCVFGNFFFKVTQKQKFKNLNKGYLNSTDFSPRGEKLLQMKFAILVKTSWMCSANVFKSCLFKADFVHFPLC